MAKYLINLTLIDGHFVKCRWDGFLDWSKSRVYSVDVLEILVKTGTELNIIPLTREINRRSRKKVLSDRRQS